MKKERPEKTRGIIGMACLLCAIMLTFPLSSARHATRHEYVLELAMAEHFVFAAGSRHTFEIPYDGYYAFRLRGGNGGDSKNAWNGGSETYTLGGSGGEVAAVKYFEAGTSLVIVVGSRGGIGSGGFNGGGSGGTESTAFNTYTGGGGGGATDVRSAAGNLSDRLLVAGGGGGGSGGSITMLGTGYAPVSGGNGGMTGGNYAGANGAGNGYGQGGSLSIGGEGYQHGAFGLGGGSRYSGGGGGGGSAYIAEGFTPGAPQGLPDATHHPGDSRDGYAVISFLGHHFSLSVLRGANRLRYDMGSPSAPLAEEATPAPDISPEPLPQSTIEPELAPEPTPEDTPEPPPEILPGEEPALQATAEPTAEPEQSLEPTEEQEEQKAAAGG